MTTNVYQTYFPIVNSAGGNGADQRLSPIAVGVDADNTNASGTLCTVPFVKRVRMVATSFTSPVRTSVDIKIPSGTLPIMAVVTTIVAGTGVVITGAGVFEIGTAAGLDEYGATQLFGPSASLSSATYTQSYALGGTTGNNAQGDFTAIPGDTNAKSNIASVTLTVDSFTFTGTLTSLTHNVSLMLVDASTFNDAFY